MRTGTDDAISQLRDVYARNGNKAESRILIVEHEFADLEAVCSYAHGVTGVHHFIPEHQPSPMLTTLQTSFDEFGLLHGDYCKEWEIDIWTQGVTAHLGALRVALQMYIIARGEELANEVLVYNIHEGTPLGMLRALQIVAAERFGHPPRPDLLPRCTERSVEGGWHGLVPGEWYADPFDGSIRQLQGEVGAWNQEDA